MSQRTAVIAIAAAAALAAPVIAAWHSADATWNNDAVPATRYIGAAPDAMPYHG